MDHLIKELFEPVNKAKLDEQKIKYTSDKSSPSPDDLKKIFGVIDLTTLDVRDTDRKVEEMCRKVVQLPDHFPGAGQVAGVCVFPVFIPVVSKTLKNVKVKAVSVSGGFPAAQTFREVKLLETKMALEQGADEIDIVISVGDVLYGDNEKAFDEIREIRDAVGDKGHLKVILESGVLNDPEKIQKAALIAMTAGANFIKTSTGKMQPAARPEDVIVMVSAIKKFYEATGIRIGIKPAGGISTPEDAFLYMKIIRDILGEEWITPALFRIGASRLANRVLRAWQSKLTGNDEEITYF